MDWRKTDEEGRARVGRKHSGQKTYGDSDPGSGRRSLASVGTGLMPLALPPVTAKSVRIIWPRPHCPLAVERSKPRVSNLMSWVYFHFPLSSLTSLSLFSASIP